MHVDWYSEVFPMVIIPNYNSYQYMEVMNCLVGVHSGLLFFENTLNKQRCCCEDGCCDVTSNVIVSAQDTVNFPCSIVHITKKNIHWLNSITLQSTLRLNCSPLTIGTNYYSLPAAKKVVEEWVMGCELNDGQLTYQFGDCLYTICRFSINGGRVYKGKTDFQEHGESFQSQPILQRKAMNGKCFRKDTVEELIQDTYFFIFRDINFEKGRTAELPKPIAIISEIEHQTDFLRMIDCFYRRLGNSERNFGPFRT